MRAADPGYRDARDQAQHAEHEHGAGAPERRHSVIRLIRLIRDELLIILGTSSSETVPPRLLAKLQAAGASKRVTGVVIPTGSSFNLVGTCIYLTLGALSIVQAAGQDGRWRPRSGCSR